MKQVVLGIISRLNSHNDNEYLFIVDEPAIDLPGGEVDIMTSEENSLIKHVREQLGIEISPVAKVAQEGNTSWWLCSTIDDCYYPAEGLYMEWLTLSQIESHPDISQLTKSFFAANFA